jgi:AcrR family transcriptional regulator
MADEARRSPRGARTRAALIGAGRQLFSKRPVDAVSVDDIVQAAEVAKGSFYNHFTDREHLVRAISAEIRASVEDAVDRVNAKEAEPARRLARAVCTYLRYGVDEPEPAAVLVRIHSGPGAMNSPLNRGLVEDITRGLGQGRFTVATLEAAALYVMGVTQAALIRITQEPSLSLAVSLAQQLCALMLRGLGLPPAEADLIAAQASDEIVRKGAYTTRSPQDLGATH